MSKAKTFQLTPYASLCELSQSIGWPEAYREDLTKYDAAMIADHKPEEPFAWSVRRCGTHLIYPDTNLATDWARACTDPMNSPSRYYIWTGSTLVEVTAPEWRDWISERVAKLPKYRFRVEYKNPWSRSGDWETYSYRAKDEETAKDLLSCDVRRAGREVCRTMGGLVADAA